MLGTLKQSQLQVFLTVLCRIILSERYVGSFVNQHVQKDKNKVYSPSSWLVTFQTGVLAKIVEWMRFFYRVPALATNLNH